MPIPQFDAANPKMISQGPSMCLFNKEDPQEVLASWLFAQYMLTNSVQIAYAQTEGYAPVTSKAQESQQYRDYLSRRGEDNELYYDVKIDATKLLMENTDNTFVTPVFNGSASLRNAAGQLIEEVTKATRRGKNLNYKTLYKDVSALYHLDQIATETKAQDFGPLPVGAVVLLTGLVVVWLAMGAYVAIQTIKKKKKKI